MAEDKVVMDLDSTQCNEDWLRNEKTRKLAATLRKRIGVPKTGKGKPAKEA